MKRQIVLMDNQRIVRSLNRMAIQVFERLEKEQEILVIGLNERGFATAQLLLEFLKPICTANKIDLYKLDVKNLTHNKPLPECSEKFVLIVDDVIFSGRTIFDALSIIVSKGEPKQIEVLSLLDRGHRKYPINSDITGMKVPTKFGEHIEVMLQNDRPEQVILFKNN